MTMLPHIASRVLDTPLVIGQAKLEAILAVIGPAYRCRGSCLRQVGDL